MFGHPTLPVEGEVDSYTDEFMRFGLLIPFERYNFRLDIYEGLDINQRIQKITKQYPVIEAPKTFEIGQLKGKRIGINWGEGGRGYLFLWQKENIVYETTVGIESYHEGKEESVQILSTFHFIK